MKKMSNRALLVIFRQFIWKYSNAYFSHKFPPENVHVHHWIFFIRSPWFHLDFTLIFAADSRKLCGESGLNSSQRLWVNTAGAGGGETRGENGNWYSENWRWYKGGFIWGRYFKSVGGILPLMLQASVYCVKCGIGLGHRRKSRFSESWSEVTFKLRSLHWDRLLLKLHQR